MSWKQTALIGVLFVFITVMASSDMPLWLLIACSATLGRLGGAKLHELND